MTLLLSQAEAELSQEALDLVSKRALDESLERERQIEAATASPFAPRVVAWGLQEKDYLTGLLGKQ